MRLSTLGIEPAYRSRVTARLHCYHRHRNRLQEGPVFRRRSRYYLRLPAGPSYGDNNTDEPPVVDPTGSELYLPGYIDTSENTGINIYSANGATQSLGTIAIPDITYQSRLVFTPDGSLVSM